ncbi:MAG: class I SAM-dependent methyltransferase [Elusimicrobiota bacterium]
MIGRHGARQKERFDPKQAARLDDPARFEYLPPRTLLGLLAIPRGATVLDFGAGTGAYALKLARARPDITVIAFDEQPRMLSLLKKKLSRFPMPNIQPLLADRKGLASLRGRMDRILALNVLHELGDAALSRMGGLLAPGGRILFVDWNAAADRPVGPPPDEVYAPAEAAERIAGFGLKVLSRRLLRYHYALVAQ